LWSKSIQKFMIFQTKTVSSPISHVPLDKITKVARTIASTHEYMLVFANIREYQYYQIDEWQRVSSSTGMKGTSVWRARVNLKSARRVRICAQNMKIAVSPERNAVRVGLRDQQLTHFMYDKHRNHNIWEQCENHPITL